MTNAKFTKKGRYKMRAKGTMVAVAVMLAAVAHGSVGVKDVKAVQRWPWNGKVDIDYTVEAEDDTTDVYVFPNGVDTDRGNTIPMLTLTGEGANAPVKRGKHRMTWDAEKDALGYNTQNFKVTMTAISGAALYLVVDLSGGMEAVTFPVRSSLTGPDLSDETCRTTDLWLRLVPPGTFVMGSPKGEPGRASSVFAGNIDETQHEVTLTKPFYMGVFEVTQKQYQLVTGNNPSVYKGDSRPVESVTYEILRGTINGALWPKSGQVDEDTFFGILIRKTGLRFDLPTEAQWEYACRAGTTTAFNNGKESMEGIGRYGNRQPDGTTEHTIVGSYIPNLWGLYDMHGNVSEWCLDLLAPYSLAAATDPVGATSGSDHARRGGGWWHSSGNCRSATRMYSQATTDKKITNSLLGFRLCCILGL